MNTTKIIIKTVETEDIKPIKNWLGEILFEKLVEINIKEKNDIIMRIFLNKLLFVIIFNLLNKK